MKHLGYIIACFVILFNVQLVKAQGDVKIGTQVWTSKNLDVSTFRNGEAIPEAKSKEEWLKAGENEQPAWCYYDNDIQNGKKYGKLYNWYAVNDSRGLAPKGYHIPSDREWSVLTRFLGGEQIAGFKMKSATGWANNGNGDNSSGFNGLPGGARHEDAPFYELERRCLWWSSTENNTENFNIRSWYRELDLNNGVYSPHINRKRGFSVRCLRENGDIKFGSNSIHVSKVDNISEKNNNTILQNYSTVTIGNQVWTSKNLDVSTFRNGEAIPEAKSKEEWLKAGENEQPAWCYYDNDVQNGKKYGKLYNWWAVNDFRGLAPKGYHIPSDEEWSVLTRFLGGVYIAGDKMKSTTGWDNNENVNNSSGFNGLPGGESDVDGNCRRVGRYGSWWSSTEYVMTVNFLQKPPYRAWANTLFHSNGNVFRGYSDAETGLSVRCLMD